MTSVMKLLVYIGVATSITACGVPHSSIRYQPDHALNTKITNNNSCYDASVLLGANLDKSRDIAKKVLIGLDSHIDVDEPNRIEAQRNRHIGIFVGSGGEEIRLGLSSIEPDKTFITVATQTGFVGGAGQKAWSCEVVDQMIGMVNRG